MRPFIVLFSMVLGSLSSGVFAQPHEPASGEKLGTVHFSTSCNSAVEPEFNRAVALMHSFQFARAIDAFHAILASDPSCSMAHWGIALSSWGNPFASGLKPQAQLEQGFKAATQARKAKPKTARERAYVEAVAHLYTDPADTSQHSRVLAYETAMETVSASYSDDTKLRSFVHSP